jgi:putative tryptophan/tyrosine transport system substrate-binding protein
MRRIGVLMGFAESDHEAQSWVAAFREELQKLGWTEGRNIEIDTRWATADVESMQRFAKELVTLQLDLILTSSTPATAAMLQQTRTTPVIFVWVADPVGSGFVASLARPGGNVTGFTPLEGSHRSSANKHWTVVISRSFAVRTRLCGRLNDWLSCAID